MPVSFEQKPSYRIDDLIEIMRILRSDGGCPWDREQTHTTLRKDMIEETYEVCEAIDSGDVELLREELGDALLQIVFHARIEQEQGSFDFDDVCDGICKKLIYRHPHVFAQVKVGDSAEVLKNWDALKKRKRARRAIHRRWKAFPRPSRR